MVEIGTTACKWDTIIPFNRYIEEKIKNKTHILYEDDFYLKRLKDGISINDIKKEWENNSKEGMWDKLNKLIKDNGAIVLFGSEPFSSALRMSNIKNYKYDWVWDKHIPRNFINAKIMPMQKHENIMVFNCKGKTNYHPQMEKRDKPVKVKNYSKKNKDSVYHLNNNGSDNIERVYEYKYPNTIIVGKWEANKGKLHKTSKPISLMEYLIKTYTNEGDLVLDFTMGSGSTGVACLNTNRKFVGIELDENYFNISLNRIKEIS